MITIISESHVFSHFKIAVLTKCEKARTHARKHRYNLITPPEKMQGKAILGV